MSNIVSLPQLEEEEEETGLPGLAGSGYAIDRAAGAASVAAANLIMFGDRRASDCGFSFVRRQCAAERAFLFIGAVSFVTVCTADWSRVVALANFMITAILWSSAKSGGGGCIFLASSARERRIRSASAASHCVTASSLDRERHSGHWLGNFGSHVRRAGGKSDASSRRFLWAS